MATIEIAPVTARYLGGQRAEVLSNDRLFSVGQRTDAGPPGSRFCPIEMVIAGFAS